MGYSTSYKLKVNAEEGESLNYNAILAELKKKNTPQKDADLLKQLKSEKKTARDIIEEFREKYEGAQYAISPSGNTNESCKWYEHEQELQEFSKTHPDVLFELVGEGEESGDLWIKYFKNGKMQRCGAEITYPPFDETKLK